MAWGNVDEVQQDDNQDENENEYQSDDSVDNGVEITAYEDEQPGEEQVHTAKNVSEKKRVENAIFAAYASRRTKEITENEVKEAIRITKDDQLSIRDILAKEENSRKITNPRDYQTELFQRAKDGNIIAVLDTGTGKTHIATLLLRHILDVELEARAKGAPHKIAFFLVDSVNLVFQQANVLRCGLDQKVEGICGAMGASLWQKPTWDGFFQKNMVIVCTAAVLHQCMMHSFIDMARVSILIFDEAHHAKSNHPYALIMKDFYVHELDVSRRPRIFGMTASPVDANTDVQDAATRLENLLHSRIATASATSFDWNKIARPREKVARYPILHHQYETPFHQEVKARYGDMGGFQKFFITSKRISSEIGCWASDKYWSFAFSEEESRKREDRKELQHNKEHNGQEVEKLNAKIARLQAASEFVQQFDFGLPSESAADLSSKVILLKGYLDEFYGRSAEARTLVFVEQRQTARLLLLIFREIGGPNLHPGMLVGNSSRGGDTNSTLKDQVLTVQKFRRGELNCLFSTSVAEEGLDIPQCNLVVRFDLYRSMIGYVQSRGRARHRNSTYLHMVEEGNSKHHEVLTNAIRAEEVMRNFCAGLPQDRFLDKLDFDVGNLRDNDGEVYIDPESGAKLTYRSSLSVLAHFVASIPSPNQGINLQPTYVLNRVFNSNPDRDGIHGFECEVILPECAPIISVIGKICRKKILAKCAAAFNMCLELRARGFLDDNLLPTYQKKLPAMRNAQLALSEKQKGNYLMRVKPDFWQIGLGTIPERLYLTIIDVDAGLDRPHQPIGLLTRMQLPVLPHFPVYLRNGRPSNVILTSLETALPITKENLERFHKVTLEMFADVYNKKYEDRIAKMTYWLVPVRSSCAVAITPLSKPEGLIDMEQILAVFNQTRDDTQWTPAMRDDDLIDKYIVDKYNGGRRFYSTALAPHLKPQDPVPESAIAAEPTRKYKDTILDWSNSLWNKAREKRSELWDKNQPVIQVERIPFRRNFLAVIEKKEQESEGELNIYVCPEPLKISMMATRFVAMVNVFPAILHRIEDYLIALEACQHIGLTITPALALEALTKDSDNSGEYGAETINFRSGMGPNYERLEFLGDCFLKMATSISTFVLQPDENEFEFHVRRMVMLCNKNLFGTAKKLKLYEWIRSMAFSRRLWYPKGLVLLEGKKTEDAPVHHQLGDKSIADVCEALIGAAFLQDNRRGHWKSTHWDQAVQAVKIFVDSEDHLMEKFSEYYAAYVKPRYQIMDATAAQLDLALQIEQRHSYHFKYPRLLRSAFLHPSQAFMWEHVPNYQRFEFLGDALLDMAFIMHLFYNYPEKDPHWLTEKKTPMVANKFLGAVSVKLGFHTHIRQNNAALTSEIRNYVTELEEAENEANGAVDYWVGISSEPPKCLADVVEAYVAAMFVDSEFNFQVVQDFFDMHLKRYFVDMTLPAYESFGSGHPTTRLNKLMTTNFGCTECRMSIRQTPSTIPGASAQVIAMVMIHGKIRFDSLGQSGRYARPRVANKALEALEGLPRYQYREKYGCDCTEDTEGGEEASKKEAEERLKEAMVPAC
ncbi:hypothetical protein K458DRAFT_342502 [Lentithecium fluviatile CBS 122367]|uniref:Dicer-like protein 1 n=1 Tax=Lentithecium fluviatile CBS 122367 TaxID=1168545 RepID=A0A6G1IVK3_9PLEO|nr:hypothetical protein K458DRAFT_342502 [Lentithecium fluviatile CBS 122367]